MKAVTLKGVLSVILGGLVSNIIEVKTFLIVMLIMVLSDLYTGISAARKRKEKIRSWGLRRTTQKLVLYFMAIMLSQAMEQAFAIPKLVYITAFYICLTEFKSNLENISFVTGTNVIEKVSEALKAFIKK